MYATQPEVGFVAKGLEDGAVEMPPQIDFSERAITESQPDDVRSQETRFDDGWDGHGVHSKGGTWMRGSLSRASFQQ